MKRRLPNRLRFVRKTLYQLKKRYGDKADLYQNSGETVNLQTGKKISTKNKYTIKKAIILPATFGTLFIKGSPTTSSNMQAPMGDLTKRLILVDRYDLPDVVTDYNNGYLVINHQRYDIKGSTVLEDELSIVFITQEVRGSPPNEIYDLNVEQILRFDQTLE